MDGWPERGCGHMELAVAGKLIGHAASSDAQS